MERERERERERDVKTPTNSTGYSVTIRYYVFQITKYDVTTSISDT